MSEIKFLNGYEKITDKIAVFIRKVAEDSPSWIFEIEEHIDLHGLRSHWGTRRKASGDEQLKKILAGHVFDVTDDWDDENQDSYDDSSWVKAQMSDAIDNVLPDIENFCEEHGLDVDEVREALDEDDCLDSNEIFDYRLYSTNYKFSGNVPVFVNANASISLSPSNDMALALSSLKIAPEDWIKAVKKEAKANPESASQFMWNNDVFSAAVFTQQLASHISKASTLGFVFASNSDQAIVNANDLVHSMCNVWNTELTDLVVRFNLDNDHINEVSMPACRGLDDHERDRLPFEILKGVELMPMSENSSGEGLTTRQSIHCTLQDIDFSRSDYDDNRAVATTRLLGAQGLLLRTYETLLACKDTKVRDDLICFASGRKLNSNKSTPFTIPTDVQKKIADLYVGITSFDAEKVSAKYPGLTHLIPVTSNLTAKEMGHTLLSLFEGAMFKPYNQWSSSEDRERAASLVRAGADLSIRSGSGSQKKVGPQAIHLASAMGDVDLVNLMHEYGADVLSTYQPKMSIDGHGVGVWEALVRCAVSYCKYNRDADIHELVDGLKWLESIDGGPFSCVSNGHKVWSSSLMDRYNQNLAVDEALAIINDSKLSTNFIERLVKEENNSIQSEKLSRALLMGLKQNSFCFSRACIDGGARTDDLLSGKTVEAIARSDVGLFYKKDTTTIDQSVAFCASLRAMEAIDSMLESLTFKKPSAHQ